MLIFGDEGDWEDEELVPAKSITEELVERWEGFLEFAEGANGGTALMSFGADTLMIKTVLEALRDKVAKEKEEDEPLTLEELREMAERCEAVYVAHTDGTPVFREQMRCAAVLEITQAFGSMGNHIMAIYGKNLTMWEDQYDRTWLAYRRKGTYS